MARRYNKQDIEGNDGPQQYPVSLAGIVKLQAKDKKVNGSWHSMEAIDLKETCKRGGFDVDDFSSLTRDLEGQLSFDPTFVVPSQAGTDPFNLPSRQTNMSRNTSPLLQRKNMPAAEPINQQEAVFISSNSKDASPTDGRFGAGDLVAQLFGKLPDPIRLHEQMGDFDGHVVFIAHPNRDISAHQWSLPSFQWENIGHYSHTRGKVEGSLASDLLKDVNLSYNSIEYFKFAAENRERLIKENGRPGELSDKAELRRPPMTDTTHMASFSTVSGSPKEQIPTLAHLKSSIPVAPKTRPTAPISHNSTVTREVLEDPFVTPAKSMQSAVPATFRTRSNTASVMGSLDFGYEFPTKSTTLAAHTGLSEVENHQLYVQREKIRLAMIRGGFEPREHDGPQNLSEVAFGEEASSALATPATRNTVNRSLIHMSPEGADSWQQRKDRLMESGDQVRHPSLPPEYRIAVPHVPALQPTLQSLVPPPGFTIANPHRINSTLNATAAPYTRMSAQVKSAEGSESELTINAPPTVNLQFSDPDGVHQEHGHEVANGLGQQEPTPQNFKGPFFTASMPTAHDPTASLSFRIGEEEKLVSWFRDGQRPARQQEYAKTLISTAMNGPKDRSYSAIDDGSTRSRNQNKYGNTPPFVRLYENLSEYLEESRAGTARSYFTRAWKPAPFHLRDLGSDGNNSFFTELRGISSQFQRGPTRSFRGAPGSTWGGFHLPSNTDLAKYTHGNLTDGGFGGPVSARFSQV